MGVIASPVAARADQPTADARALRVVRVGLWLAYRSAWRRALSRAARRPMSRHLRQGGVSAGAGGRVGARLALGHGSRASAISTSALVYSPAALALGNLYHIEGNVDYLVRPARGRARRCGRRFVDEQGRRRHRRCAAFSPATIASAASTAGSASRSRCPMRSRSASRPLHQRLERRTRRSTSQGFTMDASLRITPVEGLQIDIGALNFIDATIRTCR